MRKILIVEDHQDIADLMAMHLRDLGFQVSQHSDGLSGFDAARSGTFDLVVLDLMLPGMDGLEFCRRLREQPPYTPVMMVTARASELDRVLGLELGADDYVTKPFSVLEFVARVKALFRRIDALTDTAAVAGVSETRSTLVRCGPLVIDESCREVTVDGKAASLTAKEFDLLLHFARNRGRVYSRSQLLDLVWGYGHEGYEHNVNCHINRLRAKIEADQAHPQFILTVRGFGYKFTEHAEAAAAAAPPATAA